MCSNKTFRLEWVKIMTEKRVCWAQKTLYKRTPHCDVHITPRILWLTGLSRTNFVTNIWPSWTPAASASQKNGKLLQKDSARRTDKRHYLSAPLSLLGPDKPCGSVLLDQSKLKPNQILETSLKKTQEFRQGLTGPATLLLTWRVSLLLKHTEWRR